MRISILSGFLSLIAVYSSPSAAASVRTGDFDQLMQQLHGALMRFDLNSARTLLNQACQDTQPAAAVRTAVCEAETGVIDEAARHGDDAEAHFQRALVIWAQLTPKYT